MAMPPNNRWNRPVTLGWLRAAGAERECTLAALIRRFRAAAQLHR
jgi:hypothetical protein